MDTDNHLAAKLEKTTQKMMTLVTVAEDEGILDVAWFI